MEDANGQDRKRRPARDAPELRVVSITCNPAPDAQDRLRRLFTLLLKHATTERQDASDEGASADCLRSEDDAKVQD